MNSCDQEEESTSAKSTCQTQLYIMHEKVQDARQKLVKVHFQAIQKFDIGDVAFERMRGVVAEYTQRIENFQEDFNRFVDVEAEKLIRDIRLVCNNNHYLGLDCGLKIKIILRSWKQVS